jgi:hypothetical protein
VVAVVQAKTLMETLVVQVAVAVLEQIIISQAELALVVKDMMAAMEEETHALVVAEVLEVLAKMVQIQVVLQIMEMVWVATAEQALQLQ